MSVAAETKDLMGVPEFLRMEAAELRDRAESLEQLAYDLERPSEKAAS